MAHYGIPGGKIVTCCYCGVQSAFLADRSRHALVCSTCGAPLAAQKARPLTEPSAAKRPKPKKRGGAKAGGKTSQAAFDRLPGASSEWQALAKVALTQKARKKSRKSGWARLWDVIEDVFD